jgi:NDP-sugar pyrophosphorylase family protein
MKAVIHVVSTKSWLEKVCASSTEENLAFVNKPLVEYYLELIKCLGIEKVIILNAGAETISNKEQYESRYNLNLTFNYIHNNCSPYLIKGHVNSFLDGHNMLYFRTDSFVHWDKKISTFDFLSTDKDSFLTKSENNTFFHVDSIYTLKQYHELNIKLLMDFNENYSFPGYSLTEEQQVGKLVNMHTSAELKEAYNIGDYVDIESNVSLKNSIVGENSIVCDNVNLINSIVLDDTIVGEGLLLENKIVFNNKVISPEDGTCVEFDQIVRNKSLNESIKLFTSKISHIIFCLFLILIKSPLFYFYTLFLIPQNLLEFEKHLTNNSFKNLKVWNTCIRFRGQDLFYRLGLDKFVLFKSVLRGELKLVGTSLQHGYNEDSGAFSLCDIYESNNEIISNIHDRYYLFNKTILGDLRLVMKFYANRILEVVNG